MGKTKKRLLLLVAILMLVTFMTGCYTVPLSQAPEPNKPVVSNIGKYEAPARSISPEPVDTGGSGVG